MLQCVHGDIRERFLDAFGAAGFQRSPALSLLQPTIKTSFLFSVGFVDVLDAVAGKSVHLDGAATVQRCFRHFDMDRVSDETHLSLFEMAGALRCSGWRTADLITPLVRYLVQDCDLPIGRLHVTYFGGGNVAGEFLHPDFEARDGYLAAGIDPRQIWQGDHSTNVWFEGANSGTERSGICGPHSELFFDAAPTSVAAVDGNPITQPSRFIEVSNIVTITHRTRSGPNNGLAPLPQPLVELALGMERLEMVVAGRLSVHDTPKLRVIADVVRSTCAGNLHSEAKSKALRVVVDHARASAHLIADGGRPGAKGRGNVVRKVIRDSLGAARVIGIDLPRLFPKVAQAVAAVDDRLNPNLAPNLGVISEVFGKEAKRLLRGKSAPLP
jgi:alanyl-tRNA synthetase